MGRRGWPGPWGIAIAVAVLVAGMASLVADVPAVRATEPDVAAPRLTWHGSRTERVVALTFDDGWNARTLRQIYRVLVREHVPATFFVTGIYVQRAPGLWRQIAASGFPLANHSYLHRDARRLTARQMADDLARTRVAVEAVTGRPMLPYFRPPYGYRNRVTDRSAAAAGFPQVVMWDVTAADTARHPTVASVVRSATAGRPGSIILLHAGPRVTPRALPAIIASYRARGFRFVTLPELPGFPASPTSVAAAAPRDPSIHQVDRLDAGLGATPRPSPAGGAVAGGGRAVPPLLPVEAPPPAAAGPTVAARQAAEAAPPARAAAWARGDDAPVSVAIFTVALLALLLAVAVVAGRGAEGDARG